MVAELLAFLVFIIVVSGLVLFISSLLVSIAEAVVKRINARDHNLPTLRSLGARRDDADGEETS